MQGQPLTIFGDGTQTRAFSYIADVAPVIAAAPYHPAAHQQVFNIGADTATSVNQLANVVCQAMGVPANIRYLDARNEVEHAYASHQKVRDIFGLVEPEIALEEGIRRMAAWAKIQGPRQSKPFGEIEVLKNMPPSWRKDFSP
jgi:UDP-glucose 4-epimerase